jgi:fibro-slime domain-containing protein
VPLDNGETGGTTGSHGTNGAGGIHLGTNGSGAGGGATGAGSGGGSTCPNSVQALIRDFRGWDSSASDPGGAATKHPDFEPAVKTAEKGIAASTLGSDQRPVFGAGGVQTVASADSFEQWYHDHIADNINMRFEIALPLTPDPRDSTSMVFDNQAFFPIDNQGFGNQGQTHNYSFTTEIHTTFTYKGGESFTFIGDDDVFVYVNNQQVIDLGGIHNAQTGTVNFDQLAATLGLTVGQTYNMDIFHAERHVTESHFRMQTKFECLTSYIIPIQ